MSGLKLDDLQCPECLADGGLRQTEREQMRRIECSACAAEYPLRGELPVLIRASNALFDKTDYERETSGGTYRRRRLRLPSPSVNIARRRLLADLGRRLCQLPAANVLLLGSGRQRETIRRELGLVDSPHVRITCCDVDVTADVDVFCDAHRLPFPAHYFDALITTAVLEHVMYPEQVASEICRVVRRGGFVYSELPFMQQVHEGAYDFTRYTMSGHRRLLNGFKEIDSGVVAGPATALVWSLEHFAAALLGFGVLGTLARAGTRVTLFWLKYFDYLIADRKGASDLASCTYFFGERIEGSVPDIEIIKAYRGARVVTHA